MSEQEPVHWLRVGKCGTPPEGTPCQRCGSFGDNPDHHKQGIFEYLIMGGGEDREVEVLCHPCYRKKGREAYSRNSQAICRGRKFSQETRRKVLERDDHRCVECSSTESLHIDHIIPAVKGGDGSMANAQTLCSSCNLRKGAGPW